MWPFSRKPVAEVDLSEQHAAQAAARATLAQLNAQDQEVSAVHDALKIRGHRNNFGAALELAMERRKL